MSVTIVSGVPGVGSSRVCEAARRQLDDSYELVNFGDVMVEEAVARGIATSRDELASLPLHDYRVLQRRSAEEIDRRRREHGNSLVVDTHLAVRTDRGFLPGLPEVVFSELRPNAFVLIEAGPETIVARREGSESREYHADDEFAVSFHSQLNRAAAMNHAIRAAVPITPVSNEGDVDAAAARLVECVEAAEGR
ncbi:adenylate kinase [Halobacteriales archaeon QH_6_64_20]|nr:MAG: adenylate kinase [Halobacteriales archaeon QH_6_64_20]